MFSKKYLLLTILLCLQLANAQQPVQQEQTIQKDPVQSGFSKNQVWAIYGKPLSETIDSRKNEAWHYQNNAVVFFKDGKVTAWSNLGTLRPKAKSTKQVDPASEKNTDIILDSLFRK